VQLVTKKLEKLLLKKKSYDYLNAEIPNGFCAHCFIKEDEDFFYIMSQIDKNKDTYNKIFISAFKKQNKDELEAIKLKVKTISDKDESLSYLKFNKTTINLLNRNLSINSIEEYIEKYEYLYLHEIELLKDNKFAYTKDYPTVFNEKYLKKYEPLYSITEVMFKQYSRESRPFIDIENLKNTKEKLISIYETKDCVNKYNMLKFTKNHALYISHKEGSHIHDHTNGYYFFNDFLNDFLFETINDLIEKDFIQDISFLITSIRTDTLTLEEKEYGRRFNYDIRTLPDVSCFYEVNKPANKLIVKVEKAKEKTSITFETIKDDFNNLNDLVVTNLIHLEIDNNNNINHLDHEFIFYTLEEYDKKIKNHKQKGHSKIKTIKIDNSKIPINYTYKRVPFLIHFLMELLDNKDLIEEYFNSVLEVK